MPPKRVVMSLSYTSTFVRYKRRGGTVVPVRVTKQWVAPPAARVPQGYDPELDRPKMGTKRFVAVRVTEVPWRQLTDRDRDTVHEGEAEAWCSSQRVESRERLQTLLVAGTEDQPVLQEAGFDQCWLPLGQSPFVGDQHGWTIDNGNGWAL